MTKENAKKAVDILEEIESLSKYEELLKSRDYGNTCHFEIVEHYGNGAKQVIIDRKHNQLFLTTLQCIIAELNKELETL